MCAQSHWLMQLLRVYSASYYSSVCIVLEVDVYFLCNTDEDPVFYFSKKSC